MPKALALDLASETGWTVMQRGGPHVFGTWRAPRESAGSYSRRYSALFTWLGQIRRVHGFDALGFEAPWMNANRDTMSTLRILTGFAVVAETFAGLHQLPCVQVDSRRAKKALTGNSFAKKHQMVMAAHGLGWRVANDHEADAGAVGMCVVEQLWPKRA